MPSKVEELETALEAQQTLVNSPEFFKQESDVTQQALNQLADLESKLETAYERWEELEALQNQQ
uniref:ABC transporter ATP-binding protein n=1 Tax=Pseudoalteromonas luteoviolacea TaxID=43657 RepID=A0A023Q0F0_9GAMM|nr:ABC transporter ATP-binding protein [Pseudoalteromonas luteoviolacea]